MRTAWVNGALIVCGAAVVSFTVLAFRLPTQAPTSTSPSPLPSLGAPVGQQSHANYIPPPPKITHHHKTKKPKAKHHHHHKPTAPVYVAPTYVPPYTPPPATSPSPSPILATLPSGGKTQIPVPKHH